MKRRNNKNRKVNILDYLGIEVAHAMGQATDEILFAPPIAESKKVITLRLGLRVVIAEIRNRIYNALEALKGNYHDHDYDDYEDY